MTYFPMSADRRAVPPAATEGLWARMVRLWLEHHQRMIDLGLRPL